MCYGVICAGQSSWDAAEEAHWRQDAMPELHNNDTLWVFTLRASEELCMLDCRHLNNNMLSLGVRGQLPSGYMVSSL